MLKVYNTLSGKKEKFIPLEENKVKIYVCGLTVQNYSHLGHTRSVITYDIIRRYLRYKDYQVKYIQNFTDINEKIIARAKEEGLTPQELTEKYIQAYLEDLDALNIEKADEYCRATDNIDEIIEMVKKLLAKGYAYEVNGNVYYRVEQFADYGKLSGRNLAEMEAGSRIEVNKEKEHPMDFALWKKVEGEIAWDSPWGKGWPGWHIECSAMSIKFLGQQFDIHGGGTDLIFPHHENEIAQGEAFTGCKPYVKYWLHNGTVNLKGEKMSKSLGNFFTTRELLKKFSGDEIRYFILTKHYRSPIDFSLEEMEQAKVSLSRLINVKKNIIRLIERKDEIEDIKLEENRAVSLKEKLNSIRKDFIVAMDDDFNSAKAIAVLHELAKEINIFINNQDFVLNKESYTLLKKASTLLQEITNILGLNLEHEPKENDLEIINKLIKFILEIRAEARTEKNWQLADQIRDSLHEMGIIIKDTPQGVEWERKV